MLRWKLLIGLLLMSAALVGGLTNAEPFKPILHQAITIPLGLPSIPSASELDTNDALFQLGKQLFFDPRVSADGTVSCASCHVPTHAFTDGKPQSIGIHNQTVTRNAPSLLNVAYRTSLFWDGRSRDLVTQARLPLTSPVEHGLMSDDDVVTLVRQNPTYVSQARTIPTTSNEPITIDLIGRAIASYERTLLAGNSPFDQFTYGHKRDALSAAAQHGLTLFNGRAGCASCHSMDSTSALFSDERYHISPLGLPTLVTDDLPSLTRRVIDVAQDQAALNRLVITDPKIAALGRFVVTLDPSDIGKFKTPSLRNVAATAPYMHDGSVATLEKAIELELYSRGDTLKYPIVLTTNERADLLAFLNALTSPNAK